MRTHCLALAASLCVLAACSGGDGDNEINRDEYQREVTRQVSVVNEGILKLGLAVSRAPTRGIAENRMQTLRERLTSASSALEVLHAPDDAQEAHDDLVAAIQGMAGRLEKFAGPERAPPRPARGFLDALTTSAEARRYGEAIKRLRETGYEIG